MKNYVYIATTLDGFIAGKDGNLDWLMNIPNPDNSDYGFNDFLNKIDGIIMGRNTFEMVLSFGEWPYTKKVFVLSNRLKEVPEELSSKAEIISGDISEIVSELHSRGFYNLYIDGGKTIQSFLRLNLIDEMIITRIPVLLGEGIPLFSSMERQINFTVEKTEKLNEFLSKTYYKREKE